MFSISTHHTVRSAAAFSERGIKEGLSLGKDSLSTLSVVSRGREREIGQNLALTYTGIKKKTTTRI